MNNKVQQHHLQKPAYIYIRQSTMGQVRHHQESTERQYALRDKALALGWNSNSIRILDGDLGISGAHSSGRNDFKTLLADVITGQVGAVVALEASRLARSSADWHRLIEMCSLTGTLIIDEDGCYNPSDFNDGLLLGLKGTMSQAELHFIRARLQGGKLNKAKKGELRFPLPVGLSYSDKQIVLDPDQEVQGAVRLVFSTFRELGSAYAVVHHFGRSGLKFPKRAYGGAWAGKLQWTNLSHSRVIGLLKNPSYAGAYVYGRYRGAKEIGTNGEIALKTKRVPIEAWKVFIKDHHEGYISWQEYLQNQARLEANQTNGEDTRLSGPAREGLALLQGLLLCGCCGRKITVRYQGNGGLYPVYECAWKRREGKSSSSCLSVRCDLLDQAISARVMEVVQPAQLEVAIKALEEVERRDAALSNQWKMRIEKTEYEAQLAERRYSEVDPANRLVAATLEKRWNESLLRLEQLKKESEEHKREQRRALTLEQKAEILGLAQDFPTLWSSDTTRPKDKKRMLRLLIKDITVTRLALQKLSLQIRWQGGATEELTAERPQPVADRIRTPKSLIEDVRELAQEMDDSQIVERLNADGRTAPKGGPFTLSSIRWIRFRYGIPAHRFENDGEITVKALAQLLGVSINVVYYWIRTGVVDAKRKNPDSPYWLRLTQDKKTELEKLISNSTRIKRNRDSKTVL